MSESGGVKKTFYRGPGNHSVYELEALMAEREEEIHQRQIERQALSDKLSDLESKLDWLKKKRWALEICIANMSLANIIQISSTSDESVRERHNKLDRWFKGYITYAGGITVYTDWDKDDYKELMPCYIKPSERQKNSEDSK